MAELPASMAERQQKIVELVRLGGEAEVARLAVELGVGAVTIRRDLRALEASRLIRRSYGRVLAMESGNFETDLRQRESHSLAETERLAREAVRHLGAAGTIFVDEGFSAQLIAGHLPDDRALTVVTPSLPIAAKLSQRPLITVVIPGGRVRSNTVATVGSATEAFFRSVAIDLAFIGANGISVEYGLTTPDPAVAAVKSAAVGASRRSIFVGEHSKFGQVMFARFAQVSQLEIIVTGDRLPPAEALRYGDLGPVVIRV